jgi:hypothetical protein
MTEEQQIQEESGNDKSVETMDTKIHTSNRTALTTRTYYETELHQERKEK